MNTELVYRWLLLALFIGFVAYRGYCTRKYGRAAADGTRQQTGNPATAIANLLSLPGLLVTALFVAYPDWVNWAALPLPAWLRWAGIALALAGFGLLHAAHQALGRNWSDAPRLLEDQTLTTSGPYRWIRHPIYTAFLMIMSATLLISANWLVGGLWIALTALEIGSRIHYEEGLLLDTFGDGYRAYQMTTGRLLPRWRRAAG